MKVGTVVKIPVDYVNFISLFQSYMYRIRNKENNTNNNNKSIHQKNYYKNSKV